MNRRILVISLLTLIASLAVFKSNNIESIKNKKLFSFPNKIDKWNKETDIPLEDWVFKSLQTPYTIMRDYHTSEGGFVNLAIVWYDDKEIAFHAPEACLGGYGNTIKEKSSYNVNIGKNRSVKIGKMVAERNGVRYLILYYFLNDEYITLSQTKLKLSVFFKRFRFERTSAAFIRIMSPIVNDEKYILEELSDFFKAFFVSIKEYTDTKYIL